MTDPRSTYDLEVHDLVEHSTAAPVTPEAAGHPPADPAAPTPPESAPDWATGTAWGAPSVGNWETMPPPATPLVPTPIDPADTKRGRGFPVGPPKSLFSRLVVGVVALVIVVVTASAWGTAILLDRFLHQRLDQQLQNAATGPGFRLFNPNMTGGTPTASQASNQYWGLAWTIGGQSVSLSGAAVNPIVVSDKVAQALFSRTDQDPTTIQTVDGTNLRVVVRHTRLSVAPTDAAGNPIGQGVETQSVVVIGLDTNEISNTMHRLIVLEVAVGGVAVIVAFLLSAYGVRLSLRQLHRVTNTAREVTADLQSEGAGLDRRVPVTETGTEVGQLAESVNTLLGTVEQEFAARVESEDRMRQFLADASHELRTPLTSIRGYAELARMRRRSGQGSSSDDDDTLDRIESEGTRMSRLVDDLLTLARSDQGSDPVFELIDVDELVEDTVRGARAAYPQRRIDIATEPGLVVEGDRDQLLRVVRNLINNAAVHTKPDGAIRVRANAEPDWIALRVDDEGPGLQPEEAAHVFERFWRADKARTRAKGGSGLGLSIVTSIVANHHGQASFESSPQTGSTVTIRLPRPVVPTGS